VSGKGSDTKSSSSIKNGAATEMSKFEKEATINWRTMMVAANNNSRAVGSTMAQQAAKG